MKRNGKFKRCGGFTLVELLVVISIIALLLAILLPSLQKARESARTVVCRTQIGQMTLAASLYSTENSDKMVCYQRSIDTTHAFVWANDICPYIGNVGGAKGMQSSSWTTNQDKVLKLFTCPSQRQKLNGLNWWVRYGMSLYVGSRPIDPSKGDHRYYKSMQIKRPQEKILFGDTTDNTNRNVTAKYQVYIFRMWSNPTGWYWRHYFSLSTEGSPGMVFIPPADRHRDSNFSFVDGHVQKMLYKDVQFLDSDTPAERDKKMGLFNCRASDRVGGPWAP